MNKICQACVDDTWHDTITGPGHILASSYSSHHALIESLRGRIQELTTAFLEARAGRWKSAEFWAKIP